jgi:hypothetical protein
MGIIMVCTGIPVYIIGVKWKSKPQFFTDLLGKFVTNYNKTAYVYLFHKSEQSLKF